MSDIRTMRIGISANFSPYMFNQMQYAILDNLESRGVRLGTAYTTFPQPSGKSVFNINFRGSVTPSAMNYLKAMQSCGAEVEGVPELAKIQV
ncbi:MAG: hypothetical protein NTU57_05095 [Candidatus Aenigmarchaeota archaeon]|nr:hypothetical protein [Candidatus Aenigmarchaeota archaeon]